MANELPASKSRTGNICCEEAGSDIQSTAQALLKSHYHGKHGRHGKEKLAGPNLFKGAEDQSKPLCDKPSCFPCVPCLPWFTPFPWFSGTIS
jgi:hypothetical protein